MSGVFLEGDFLTRVILAVVVLGAGASYGAELEGLLSVPGILAADAQETAELKVRAKPNVTSPVVAVLTRDGIFLGKAKTASCTWTELCPTLFHEPKERSLLVLRKAKGDFFEVVLTADGKKTGWVQSETRFRPLSELVLRPVAYLTTAWDGRLYPEAGALAAIALGRPEGALIGVKVMGTQSLDDSTWVQVEIFPVPPCDTEETDEKSMGQGWVKAAASTVAPTVWNALDCP